MKYLILGGGGFIGSTLCDQLIEKGHFIKIFERPGVKPYRKFAREDRVEWVEGDFSNRHDVSTALLGIDVVFHLISTTIPKNSNDNPIYDVQSNLLSTLQLLTLMVEKNVSKIVFSSSGGTVYGLPKYLPIDEKHPTNPIVSYGVTKLSIEKFLLLFQHNYGIRTIILRITNPYGIRQRYDIAQGAVGVFMSRILRNEPIEVWGNSRIIRDYIYITDIARAFILAADYRGVHDIFNIGSGEGVSLNELILLIQEISGLTAKTKNIIARKFDVGTNFLDNSLALQEFNWRPLVTLSEGIRITFDWMKSIDVTSKLIED